MEKHINLLRYLVNNFDNEYDDVIKNILTKIFNNYYVNRSKYIYNIDNLYKKYDDTKYEILTNKFGINKKDDLIFRFNRYNKKYYIKKLLYQKGIDNDDLLNDILKNDKITNYKEYIDDLKIDKETFQIKLVRHYCYHTPCLNKIIGDNYYCHLHI